MHVESVLFQNLNIYAVKGIFATMSNTMIVGIVISIVVILLLFYVGSFAFLNTDIILLVFVVFVYSNYSGSPLPHIRISNTSCSFPPLTRLKMLIWGGEPY